MMFYTNIMAAWLHYNSDILRDVSDVLSHPPENDTVLRVIDNMRNRTRDEADTMSQIYYQEINDLAQEEAAQCPPIVSMYSGLYRQRRNTGVTSDT